VPPEKVPDPLGFIQTTGPRPLRQGKGQKEKGRKQECETTKSTKDAKGQKDKWRTPLRASFVPASYALCFVLFAAFVVSISKYRLKTRCYAFAALNLN
jgi:hypothetical protein